MTVERRQAKSGEVLDMTHNGYARDFDLVHERELALTKNGERFIGEDRLVGAGATAGGTAPQFHIRFHLHPRVQATKLEEDKKIELLLASGQNCCSRRSAWTPVSTTASSSPRRKARAAASRSC